MARVDSKLRVKLPERIAQRYGIEPGDEIEFEAAGELIRVIPSRRRREGRLSAEERLRLFDAATERQREREKGMKITVYPRGGRGWTREELYTRGE